MPFFFPLAEALAKSQALGEEGEVDQSLMLSQQVSGPIYSPPVLPLTGFPDLGWTQADAYKKQHEEMYKRLSAPDRVMTVCEICGVFINSTDMEYQKQRLVCV